MENLIEQLAPKQDHYSFIPQVGGHTKRVRVASVEDAAAKWAQFRDESGAGVSEIGNGGTVYGTVNKRGCHVIAKIAYNGRIERVA